MLNVYDVLTGNIGVEEPRERVPDECGTGGTPRGGGSPGAGDDNQQGDWNWWKLGEQSVVWYGYHWYRTDDPGLQYDGWEKYAELMNDSWEAGYDTFLKPHNWEYTVDHSK